MHSQHRIDATPTYRNNLWLNFPVKNAKWMIDNKQITDWTKKIAHTKAIWPQSFPTANQWYFCSHRLWTGKYIPHSFDRAKKEKKKITNRGHRLRTTKLVFHSHSIHQSVSGSLFAPDDNRFSDLSRSRTNNSCSRCLLCAGRLMAIWNAIIRLFRCMTERKTISRSLKRPRLRTEFSAETNQSLPSIGDFTLFQATSKNECGAQPKTTTKKKRKLKRQLCSG